MGEKEEKKFGKYSVEISNRDKVFFPKSEYTKGDLIDYYEKIAEVILPHIENRPLTMIRFPDGIDGKKFYQKDAPDYFPDWIEKKEVKNQDGTTTNYVICNNKASLVYLANQACITPHIWLSKKDRPETPDRMIFDLDPANEDFSKVKWAAEKLKELLQDKLELPTFLMTTGSKGLHIVVPIKREKSFDEVRNFAQKISDYLEKKYPEDLTSAIRKNKRGDKIFLDIARNAFAQTAVAPYSVRPINGAPVATPLDWQELKKNDIHSQSYTIQNIFRRLGSKKDPWENIDDSVVSLDKAVKKFSDLHDVEEDKN